MKDRKTETQAKSVPKQGVIVFYAVGIKFHENVMSSLAYHLIGAF